MESGRPVDKPKRSSRLPVATRPEYLHLDNPEHSSTSSLLAPPLDKKSTSEPELNSTRHWAITAQGFPPGVTVDELKQYRRRKPPLHLRPQDNLHVEDGSLRAFKTEYRRRFQAYGPAEAPPRSPGVLCKKREDLLGEEKVFKGEYRESFIDFPRERPKLRRPKPNLYPDKNHPMEFITEKNEKYIRFLEAERAKLLRRATALKPEGEMVTETEVRREYREYVSPEKTKTMRRPSALRLEGEFQTMTEQKDKYVLLLNKRPVIEKRSTLLKMEGEFDFVTEKGMKYVQHDVRRRALMRKRSTSLKLDGEVEYHPEYSNSYVDFPRTRPVLYRPSGNLTYEGEFEKQTETGTQFVNYEHAAVAASARPENNLNAEGSMEIHPEYKESFIDFPRERPLMRRPESHLKAEGELQSLTEKSEHFVDYVRAGKQKSEMARRPTNLKLEGSVDFQTEKGEKFKRHNSSRAESSRRNSNLKLEGELDFLTEKQEKYIPNAPAERKYFPRRQSNLKMEGEFYTVPEYRRSFTDFPRERPVMRKPEEQLHFNGNQPLDCETEKSLMYVPHKVDTPRRRRPKENLKPEGEIETQAEYNSKYLDFPRQRPTAKRPRGNLTNTGELEQTSEKASQYVSYGNIPRESSRRRPENNLKLEGPMEKEAEYRSRFVEYPVCMERTNKPNDNLKREGRGEENLGLFGSEKAKTFPAFQVLDVKGQVGCQSMAESISDKSSSSDATSEASLQHPTYRLEVHNVDETNQGFHKNGQRVFPQEAIVSHEIEADKEKRQAVLEAALKRKEIFGRSLKSPEVPKYLEKNNNFVKPARKTSAKFDENGNDRSFVVLDNGTFRNSETLKEDILKKNEPAEWMQPSWMNTYTAA